MDIRERYEQIRENMEKACAQAGRAPSEVALLAVTKFVDTERIAAAIACGVTAVGENRVQEWQDKRDFFAAQGVETHLIGQLQTNKVKYVIGGGLKLIQSVDRSALAEALERQCEKENCTQDLLLEINIGGEEQKGGVTPQALPALLEMISAQPHIRVRGLMCVPPAVGAEEARGYFERMRKLFESLRAYPADNVCMEQLSMGMSGDYMAAIQEGATMVRIGTALFGDRYGSRPGAV